MTFLSISDNILKVNWKALNRVFCFHKKEIYVLSGQFVGDSLTKGNDFTVKVRCKKCDKLFPADQKRVREFLEVQIAYHGMIRAGKQLKEIIEKYRKK